MMPTVEILVGDVRDTLKSLPDQTVHCCVTSPPYFGLRDYGCAGQIGLEGSPDAYVAQLVAVFSELRRALKDDGTLWLNLGDSYAADRGGHYMPAETLAGGGDEGVGGRVVEGAEDDAELGERAGDDEGLRSLGFPVGEVRRADEGGGRGRAVERVGGEELG